MPDPRVLPILAMLYQLERAQWMDRAAHRRLLFGQLDLLLRTAHRNVAYYNEALGGAGYDPNRPLDEAGWANVPFLTRRTLQDQGKRLLSGDIPQVMQPFKHTKSSGSTGMPVEVYQPSTKNPMMYATAVFEPLIHGADFSGKTAAIRVLRNQDPLKPVRGADWGGPISVLLRTGPSAAIASETDPEQQADWVIAEKPHILQMFPSSLEALLPVLKAKGAALDNLAYFRTLGEQLPERIREDVRTLFDRRIVDSYSAQEVGLIAIQCPEHDHYHLVHDMIFTEVLRDDGTPCAPGEVGRVVVTDLFNPAFPLIRYEVGDFAEMGEPCDCGRTWPVINRVMGRVRNLITFPDGHREWPRAPSRDISNAIPMAQYQIVQKAIDKLHVNLVMKRPLTEDDRKQVIAITKAKLGKVFDISVAEVSAIERSASGKYEEFKSEI